MATINPPKSVKQFPLVVIKNMIMLATSGFGVVVALAWNDAIKAGVETYIDPYLGKSSGLISLFIYAAIMTFLAVLVTMQLSQIEKRLETFRQKPQPKPAKTLALPKVLAAKKSVKSVKKSPQKAS